MKRKWLLVLASTMLVTGVCFLVPKAKEVKATTVSVKTSEIDWGEIPTTDQDDVVFAGWYADEDYTTPLTGKPTDGDTLCYAKWVDQNVLSVKLQAAVASENQTKLRLLSSVDTLNYKNVGFEIYFTPEGETERKTVFTDTKVLKEINAVHTGVTYEYSPKVISADSEYFITGTMTKIADKNLDRDFYVKPFWTTCDGTKVYGVSRMFAINDCIGGDLINVSVKDNASGTLTAGEAVTVTIGTGTTTDVSASVVGERDGYVHLNVVKARTDLDSTTKVTYNEESTIYQNLLSKSTADTSWYDADPDADKYVLTTAADLKGVQAKGLDFANKEIYLVTDVALSEQWTPITSMAGTFDGQGHTISNLLITSAKNKGMFASVSGIVRNFTLSNSTIVADDSSGAIIGNLSGELNSIYVDNTVRVAYSNKKNVGGLVGEINSTSGTAKIIDCGFAGTVNWLNANTTAPTSDGGHGGIVGVVNGGTCELVNCMMLGTVEKGYNVGGLIGYVASGGTATLRNCLVTGTVSGTRTFSHTSLTESVRAVDTIVGVNVGSIYVEDVYTAGTNEGTLSGEAFVNLNSNNVIDGIGLNWGGSAYIYGLTEEVAQTDLTGSVAWNKLNLDFYSKHNEDGVWVAIDGGLPKLKIAVTETDTVLEEDYTGTTARLGWYYMKTKSTNKGSATVDVTPSEGTVFEIETVGDMHGLCNLVNANTDTFSGHTVELCNDLIFNPNWDGTSTNTANANNWTGIGTNAFAGTFDGKNHTISKVYQSRAGTAGGLFRRVSGTLQNLTISDSSFNSEYNYIAGAVGHLSGTMDNVHLDAGVTVYGGSSSYHVGGLTSYINSAATINNCSFAGTVTGGFSTRGTGGLIGTVQETNAGTCTISNCAFTGTVNGTKPAGGILGMVMAVTGIQLDVNITDCVVSGTVTLTETSSQRGSVCGRSEANTKIMLTNVDTSSCNQTTRCASAETGTVVDNDAATTTE